MVYKGPRRGCQNCKWRHIKCDGASPNCGNCLRRDDICSGVEDGLDAVLRDESSQTAERVKRKRNAVILRPKREPPYIPLTHGVDDGREMEALCFFFDTYVDTDKHPDVWPNFLEQLAPVWATARSDTAVVHAASAIAVFLQEAWNFQYPETDRCRRFHARAIKSMVKAINDPQECVEDHTLLAVLLLEFYDNLKNGIRSQNYTGTHHRGSVALIRLRGKRNYDSELSRRLLIGVRHQMLSQANRRDTAIDLLDDKIWSNGSVQMPTNHAIKLDLIKLDWVSLETPYMDLIARGGIWQLSETDRIENMKALAIKAKVLDKKLITWYQTMPPAWQPIKVTGSCIPESVRQAGLYSDHCEIYHDVNVASVINVYRTVRVCTLLWLIQLSSILRKVSAPMHGLWGSEESDARTTLQEIVDDVCASVPYHLGNRLTARHFLDPDYEYPHLESERTASLSNRRGATSLGGWLLLAPLRAITIMIQKHDEAAGSAGQPLIRIGQWAWLTRQIRRIAKVYLITPSDSAAPTPLSSAGSTTPIAVGTSAGSGTGTVIDLGDEARQVIDGEEEELKPVEVGNIGIDFDP